MDNKNLIRVLKDNIKIAKGYLKQSHTQEAKNKLQGYIDGMEWAIILAKNPIEHFSKN